MVGLLARVGLRGEFRHFVRRGGCGARRRVRARRQRTGAALGPDMARHLATGAGLPVDEALATVAARLSPSIGLIDK